MANLRLTSIDIAKSIAIFLVVLGHIASNGSICKSVIYSFHMPLFFVMSGILLDVPNSFSFTDFVQFIFKKFRTLMVPFFVWGLIYSSLNIHNVKNVFYGSWQSLGEASSLSSLWFLPVLFLAIVESYLAIFCSRRIFNNPYGALLVAFVLFIVGYCLPHNRTGEGNFWGVNLSVMAASFICIGVFAKPYIVEASKKGPLVHALLSLLSVSLFVLTFSCLDAQVTPYTRFASADYGAWASFLLNALFGSISVIFISLLLTDFIKQSAIFRIIATNTLGIFVIHKFYIKVALQFVQFSDSALFAFLFSLAIFGVSFLSAVLIDYLCPSIFGHRSK